jgi:quercetin dioxygenase-like cupin family protein
MAGTSAEGKSMNSMEKWVSVVFATLSIGLAPAHFAWRQEGASSAHGKTKDRARIVLSKPLAKLDGDHLKAVLLEVHYGPGEASSPHFHPCAVMGYVVEGKIRTQVEGEPEAIYKAGESFYEAPDGVHLVSANASSKEPATFVAYLICDRDTPLSLDLPKSHREGAPR